MNIMNMINKMRLHKDFGSIGTFRTGKIWEQFRHEPKKRGFGTSRAKKLDSRIFMQEL